MLVAHQVGEHITYYKLLQIIIQYSTDHHHVNLFLIQQCKPSIHPALLGVLFTQDVAGMSKRCRRHKAMTLGSTHRGLHHGHHASVGSIHVCVWSMDRPCAAADTIRGW